MVVSKSSDVSRLDWHFDLNGRGRVENDGVVVVLRVEVIGARRRKNHLQQDLPELFVLVAVDDEVDGRVDRR